jgi:hypothetical protein
MKSRANSQARTQIMAHPSQIKQNQLGSYNKYAAPPQPQPQPYQNHKMQQPPPMPSYSSQVQEPYGAKEDKFKISIGDAIGLITLRLGKMEQFIQERQSVFSTDNVKTNDTSISSETIQSIMNRIVLLENKVMDFLKEKSDQPQNAKIAKENKELKKNFETMAKQFNSFFNETNTKWKNYEEMKIEHETNIKNIHLHLQTLEEKMVDKIDEVSSHNNDMDNKSEEEEEEVSEEEEEESEEEEEVESIQINYKNKNIDI